MDDQLDASQKTAQIVAGGGRWSSADSKSSWKPETSHCGIDVAVTWGERIHDLALRPPVHHQGGPDRHADPKGDVKSPRCRLSAVKGSVPAKTLE